MKIAFVDDEQECLDEMSRLCGSFGEETGYPVETFPFGNGESFLEAFEGIRTDWHIELPDPLPFFELDMAALFGNLMENAIAGCRTACPETRYFCLITQVLHGNTLYIVSTNSFGGKVKKGKEGYRSTKHSGNGIGLSAITATAEKYGGSAKASHSGSEFFVDIALKL